MKACGHDANVARESLFNTRRAEITNALDRWTESYVGYCKKAIVRTMLGLAEPPFDLTFDDEFQAWVGNHANTLKANARETLISLKSVTSSWVDERFDAHLIHIADQARTDLAARIAAHEAEAKAQIASHKQRRDTEVEAMRVEMIRETDNAREYARNFLETEKARLQAEHDRDIGAFKHNLKIESERLKDNATKAAKAGVKSVARSVANRPSRQNTPLHRPKPLPTSPSIYTVLDSSDAPEATPTPQATPRASPAPLSPLIITPLATPSNPRRPRSRRPPRPP
jgi:hypothetical protein